MKADREPDSKLELESSESAASSAKESVEWKPLSLPENAPPPDQEIKEALPHAMENPQPLTPNPFLKETSDTPERWDDVLGAQVTVPETKGKKIGLLGGPAAGKTYFFHALVYRTLDDRNSGAVSSYVRSSHVWVSQAAGAQASEVDLRKLVNAYEKWITLLRTPVDRPAWYRLRLGFRMGWLGNGPTSLEVEFLDGSGEGFISPLNDLTRPVWAAAFCQADIMVFCLPMWAAFPVAGLDEEEEKQRERYLDEFSMVLRNYNETRNRDLKVRAILALTMADDERRCALQSVVQRWIKSYANAPETYLRQLRKRSGVTRYLASAREWSEYLHRKFSELASPLVRRISTIDLDFGRGSPWIIPVSALDGGLLQRVESSRKMGAPIRGLPSPVPVHVELPLLAALCEYHNVLM